MNAPLNPHPNAVAAWEEAIADIRGKFPEHAFQLSLIIDIPQRQFYEVSAGLEDDPRYAKAAPSRAALLILQALKDWLLLPVTKPPAKAPPKKTPKRRKKS